MTDETNVTEGKDSKFFIYGGLIIHADKLSELTSQVEAIRVEAGLHPTDSLKFDSRARPKQVSIAEYTAAKNAVIEACCSLDVQFLAYMILHKIAAAEGNEILVGYGLNTIVSVFNFSYLVDRQDYGIVVVDRLPFKQDYDFLKDKFSTGLEMDNGNVHRLARINLFASSCDGASHLSSAVDIVLGAFRYCVNQTGDSTVPKKLFPKLVGMMWHHQVGDTRYFRDYGLSLRPKAVKVAAYKAEYDAVLTRLQSLLDEDEQNDSDR